MNIEYDFKEVLLDIKQDIAKLDGKLDKLDEKVDTQEFINRGIIIRLILAVLGGVKIFRLM